jgi:hypothetical protein
MTYGRALKAAGDADEEALQSIRFEWGYEIAFIDDEEAERFSRKLLHKAQRLRVPIPDYYVGSTLSPDYEETRISNKIVLSTSGAQKVRKEIREEQKWRSEARARAIQFITAISGLIGTLIGLVAVLHKFGT